uniref:Ubiquitin-activating enzyme E1 C-terminal domain-containing protein n=1 Tax=Fibrocapsa japonica TaxID=94617 RepID=A0A7S2V873_9STRA|mmetsp:Transcript_7645/g.11634  ORF Transcript_7645/g.11634 Transcript_7645/m.11634 type:complete len:207 (+) Transcript_7645:1-621(+)
MALVMAASNLRARNYSIPEADLHRSRLIAGKILPAIATTTALVTGLVCLELLKLMRASGPGAPATPLAAYKNGFVNLALPLFTFSEPYPPATTKAMVKGKEWNWSAWDRIDMDIGNVTLKEFIAHFEEKFSLEVTMLSHGVSILFSFFASKKKVQQRMPMKMTEVVTAVTGKEVDTSTQKYMIFEVICSDLETGEEVEVPYVRFKL